jgi:putative ABC transport system substrate-binding protein
LERGDSVRRYGGLEVLALTLASAISTLVALPGDAADPVQRVVRVGLVSPLSPSSPYSLRYEPEFWKHLHGLGWVEGQNLVAETRWAEGRSERLPALVAELIEHKVDVLVTIGSQAAVAAKNATTTIPIVIVAVGDPISAGLVTSLARPGGNLTGMSLGWVEGIEGKWLQLSQEMVPRLSTLAVIANPTSPIYGKYLQRLEAIAPTRGLKVRIIDVRGPDTLDNAFEQARRTAQAVLVAADANLLTEQQRIVALAAKHRLPDMHVVREFVEAGGLMAYAPELRVVYRHAADYVDKILRGAKPGDLPIEQPTRFELVVNLRTAKVLGLRIPESILLRADEVIR